MLNVQNYNKCQTFIKDWLLISKGGVIHTYLSSKFWEKSLVISNYIF